MAPVLVVYPQVPTEPPLTALSCQPLPHVMLPPLGHGHSHLQSCAPEMLLIRVCRPCANYCSHSAVVLPKLRVQC